MPSVPRLEDVMDTLGVACENAINAAGITAPADGAKGYPVSTELVKILAAGGYFVGVCPLGNPKNATRYSPDDQRVQVKPTASLIATVNGNVLTFSGTSTPGVNVHTFVGQDAYWQTVAGDTPNSAATKTAAAINALAISGISATASNASVTVTGSSVQCNVAGTGSVTSEVLRKAQLVQVSIYAPSSVIRFAVGDAIMTRVGTAKSHHLTLSDGADMFVNYQAERFIDKAQSSYSCLEWHITYSCEYPETLTEVAAQIGAGELIRVVNNNAPVTIYSA